MRSVKEDCRDAGPPKYTDSFLGPITTTLSTGIIQSKSHYSMPGDFKSADTILKEFSKALSVEVETLVPAFSVRN
jgi:hypothetical protein